MEKTKRKILSLDGDTLEVIFRYDSDNDVWHGEYPNLIENPRYTPNGRPWVDVVKDDCTYATGKLGDCGGCEHFCRQDEPDLIGICMNDNLRVNGGELK